MRGRRTLLAVVTVLGLALVWFALTAPDRATGLSPLVFTRLPVEALVLVALALLLPHRAVTVTATVVGLLLGVLTVLRLLDMSFWVTLDRPFDPVVDWRYLGPLTGLVVDSVGRTAGAGLLLSVAVVVLLLLVTLPLALRRLATVVARHRRGSWRVVLVGSLVWLGCALLGVATATGGPVATTSASTYAFQQARRVPVEIADERAFATATRHDPLLRTPRSDLLTGLRGKDVELVFVESYGRVAVQGSSFSPGVDAVLDAGTRQLARAGFGARSAFLRSPTYGGISWLAHSTMQSGLWVDSQQRYSVLLRSRRGTLTGAFGRAGWRTVSDIPSDTRDWPQGAFYGYDKFYDSRNVGYAGPRFGYPTMPDQYTLDAFHRLELARHPRPPVMAEIDLVTSHAPWSRTPTLLPPDRVGNGSVFDGMPQRTPSKAVIWRSPQRIRAAYGRSIQYSLKALVSDLVTHGNRNTVVVFLGDHQPAGVVSGSNAGHDVPVTVVARDPRVLDRISGWGWTPGLRPATGSPVWRMDAFRDRFLRAYSSPTPTLNPGTGSGVVHR